MRKQGFRESTCGYAVQVLNSVNRHASLLDPETVKEYLAKATFSEARKERVSHDLARFYKWKGIPFEKPRYRKVKKLPFIPLETEVDQLIGGMGKKTACLLQLLRETGMRCGEASAAKWTDIDYERSTIVVQPEKHGRSRIQRKADSREVIDYSASLRLFLNSQPLSAFPGLVHILPNQRVFLVVFSSGKIVCNRCKTEVCPYYVVLTFQRKLDELGLIDYHY